MEKIIIQPKMSKINLNCMYFEIKLSMKGDIYRARSSSLSKISNIKNIRPEGSSKYSFESAIQNLIPKIEQSLEDTNFKLGKIFTNENGKILFSLENTVFENQQEYYKSTNSLNNMILSFTNLLQHLYSTPENINKLEEVSNTLNNNLISFDEQSKIIQNNISESTKVIHFKDIILEWQQYLNERTQKDFDDENYFSPNTLESYNRNLWSYVFPYLEEHPESDNIYLFSEKETDEILSMTKSKETQRVILIALRLALDYAKEQSYIEINPIADKKIKTKKKTNKNNNSYEFIEEENRALWINCMIKNMDLKSKYHKQTDAPLAFLFTLLHGTRPEETCGIRWVDVNFNDDDILIQNAHKNVPIYDENTMKRIGWKDEDGPLKTPESYRHIPIDLLIKDLLIEHKKQQKNEFLKNNKKWSEDQYVFYNSSRTPFVPTVLSRNFLKFIRKNKLPHMVLYGLRHSFATHCRYLGMPPEVLAPLMGHTQYETTQKYYIHISSQQKREELQKIQKKDYKKYLGEENKDLIHLQNNITNLKEVQKEDMTHYLELNDETLNVLKSFITQLQEKNIA